MEIESLRQIRMKFLEKVVQHTITVLNYSLPMFAKEVTQLYNFVRIADNYVDSVPQDTEGFLNFKNEYYEVLSGKESDNKVITEFVKLSKKRQFENEWVDAFLHSMEMDTYKSNYENLDELNTYLWICRSNWIDDE